MHKYHELLKAALPLLNYIEATPEESGFDPLEYHVIVNRARDLRNKITAIEYSEKYNAEITELAQLIYRNMAGTVINVGFKWDEADDEDKELMHVVAVAVLTCFKKKENL